MQSSPRSLRIFDLAIYGFLAVVMAIADTVAIVGRNHDTIYYSLPEWLRLTGWIFAAGIALACALMNRRPRWPFLAFMVLMPALKGGAYLSLWAVWFLSGQPIDPLGAAAWYAATLQLFPALWVIRLIAHWGDDE